MYSEQIVLFLDIPLAVEYKFFGILIFLYSFSV